ncbi:hypothetical protein CEQ03_22700 [Stenotrophomonas maltophilia]|nr:hypothetical protein CEQ03_22700 [Stenotrophomonas maltophilia]QEU32683.1 hypothetical protein FOB57_05875 [Stenotrophomonas maltophilia]
MPAAGRQPGNATEDHEVAGQRPALPDCARAVASGDARRTGTRGCGGATASRQRSKHGSAGRWPATWQCHRRS